MKLYIHNFLFFVVLMRLFLRFYREGSTVVLFLLLFLESFAVGQIKLVVNPFLAGSEIILDSYLSLSNDKLGLKLEAIPLSNRGNSKIIGYSFKTQGDWGKLSLGRLSSETFLVDAGALSLEESFGLESKGFNKKLLLKPWLSRDIYSLKAHYLSPAMAENYYLGITLANKRKDLRGYFQGNWNNLDFKASLALSDTAPLMVGFNAQYLGAILGGSFGKNCGTLGFGYGFGPIKVAVTSLFEPDNRTNKVMLQYKINKELTSMVSFGADYEEKIFLAGVSYSLA